MAKTEETDGELTPGEQRRRTALRDSSEYARAVERSPEMREIQRRKRVPGRSLSSEEFRSRYLA